MDNEKPKEIKPGVCIPWEERIKDYPRITGDEQVVKKVWEEVDQLAYVFVWSCLISW